MIRIILLLLISNLSFSIDNEIRLDGTPKSYFIPYETSKFLLFGETEGNLTSLLELKGVLPKNVKVSLKGASGEINNINELLENNKFFKLKIRNKKAHSNFHKKCVDIQIENDTNFDKPRPKEYPPTNHEFCNVAGINVMADLANSLHDTYGGKWSVGNACSYFISQIDDLSPPNKDWLCANFNHYDLYQLGVDCFDSLFATRSFKNNEFYGFLSKDSCLSESSKYVVMIELDFSAFNWNEYESGFDITLRAYEEKLSKGKEASLKPKSEGRYAPKPIVMMNWLGSTCGNKIRVVKWRDGKPIKTTNLNVYSLLSYKEMVLNLAVIDKALKGGYGTVELLNKDRAYGVCFNLIRKRQNKNGYKR